jgi:hypothetical protein
MSLFRSVTVGLLGACLYFVVQLSGAQPTEPPVVQREPIKITQQVAVVDVAAGVPAMSIPSLVRLSPGERVTIVDDEHVANDLAAGAAIVEGARAKRFVDLTVETRHASRRVLVLLH